MKIFKSSKEENQWMSISDLMSVLMIIFLFISVVYMRSIGQKNSQITSIAKTYEKTQVKITHDLKEEFAKNLQIWNAALDSLTLSIRFENPEILFKVGSAELNDHFKSILDSFFPRFIQILTDPKYKKYIEEIRIEGHTSSEWQGEPSSRQAYFNNMELSQDRTRKVLEYVLFQIKDEELFNWTKNRLTANGLSSSKLIYNNDQTEDQERSRRVEFKIKTNAEQQIINILEQSKSKP
ncbi:MULTISPECIES: OmpA/MotB family protein [Butyricimonas]|uniref:OmpA/MotB family protein n=1 Tax=Butyricimonas TaxID=574697 RepID=UPI001D07BE1C|nr:MULTISPECIES: OmpA family protein [Butyricimonas]MCB6972381.1 OmpA family protein [Butyricimonas synergistica]MCG4519389.1 OmpA family protein [Butyricimonas sp. DFI.6.44]